MITVGRKILSLFLALALAVVYGMPVHHVVAAAPTGLPDTADQVVQGRSGDGAADEYAGRDVVQAADPQDCSSCTDCDDVCGSCAHCSAAIFAVVSPSPVPKSAYPSAISADRVDHYPPAEAEPPRLLRS